MPLRVMCFCTEATEAFGPSSRQRDAAAFLRALKGEELACRARVPVLGQERELDQSNRNDTIDWFGEMVTEQFRRHSIAPPFTLVPVPGRKITLDSSAGPWTALLAISIVPHFSNGVEVRDVLRWREEWPPESDPLQSKDPGELYQNLSLIGEQTWEEPVILVDYVLTTGALLRACASVLRADGARVVLALCAGRRVRSSTLDAFRVVGGELPGFRL